MTERLSERMEQLESPLDRVENRVNGLATSSQISELHTRIDSMGNQINARLDVMDSQINARLDSMTSQISTRMDGMDNRLNTRLNTMDGRLNDITRVGIGIIITMLISVIGLIVAGITQ